MGIPHISIGLLIVVLLAYLAGAKWPCLAQKIGVA